MKPLLLLQLLLLLLLLLFFPQLAHVHHTRNLPDAIAVNDIRIVVPLGTLLLPRPALHLLTCCCCFRIWPTLQLGAASSCCSLLRGPAARQKPPGRPVSPQQHQLGLKLPVRLCGSSCSQQHSALAAPT